MKLFIIRHAHAVDAGKNSLRPLSKRGRAQVRAMADFLAAGAGLSAHEVWHSPLARSVETAQLLVERLGLEAQLREVDGLTGKDDLRGIARRIAVRTESLAIVGHEPQLGGLVTFLVTGRVGLSHFTLKKCAIVCMENDAGLWSVRWHISPELLGATKR